MSITGEVDANAYVLNRVFHFPTDHGSALAVSVSAADASSILSVYSILVNTAVGQIWAIIIIIGVYATLRQPPESRSHNAVVASVGILNAKRPLDVSTISFTYLWKLKRKSPWMVLLWLFVSVLALIASAGVPALIGRRMVLGHGAPVRPEHIYLPDSRGTDDHIKLNTFYIPSALRAAGTVQINTGRLAGPNVQIEKSNVIRDLGNGEFINRYNYHYQVTAKDLGLQCYSDLTLYVDGTCIVEYGWNSDTSQPNKYMVWKNKNITFDANNGKFQSPGPMAYFRPENPGSFDSWNYLNTLFAILISSVGRSSVSEGKDPMYLTEPSEVDLLGNQRYKVRDGRPALSCWQVDTWQYLSQNHSVTKLSDSNSSLVNFPRALQYILTQSLSIPMIINIGQRLGSSALYSSTRSAVGRTFDAGGASVLADLTYLVFASYIATKNTLADTALNSGQNASTIGVPNLVEKKDLNDVAIFVLYSNDISAFSLTVLISVPIVVVLLFITAYFVTTHRWFPWHVVQGYQATILYSLLDESAFAAESALSEQPGSLESVDKRIWKRKSIAWMKGPRIYGRHTSVVTGTDGKPTLALVGGVDIPLHTEGSVNRSVSRS